MKRFLQFALFLLAVGMPVVAQIPSTYSNVWNGTQSFNGPLTTLDIGQLFTVGTGGVTANQIVSFDASGNAIAATGMGFGGIAATTVNAGGQVEVVRSGIGTVVFDGAAVVGDIAIPSTTVPGEAHDSGFTSKQFIPSTTDIIGPIESAVSGSGSTGTVRLYGPGSFGAMTNSFRVGNTFQADGFTTSVFPGIGTVPVTWDTTGATSYPLCSTVTYSSQDYLAVGAPEANLGVTPGTNSAIWYNIGTGVVSQATTQEQCAFYYALAAAGNAGNGLSNVVLYHGGHGMTGSFYDINGPLNEPAIGPQVEMIGASKGDNGTPVSIRAGHSMSTMLLKPSLSSPASTPYSMHIANIDFDGNGLASEGVWISGAKVGLAEHLSFHNLVGSSDWFRLGDSSQPSGEGYGYQWIVNDVQDNSGGGTQASITVTQSGGVPTFTVNSPGSYNYYSSPVLYGYDLSPIVPTVTFFGTGASGTSHQPCTTMGTLSVTMSGNGIGSITPTGFAGCGGAMYAIADDQPAAAVGILIDDITDSSFTDLISNNVGTTAGIQFNHSGNSVVHAHPYGMAVGIISNNQNMFVNTELDSLFEYGAIPNFADNWSNTNFTYNALYPGAKGFYTGGIGYFHSKGSTCGGTPQTTGTFALVSGINGDYAHGVGGYNATFEVSGQQCDDLSIVNSLPSLRLSGAPSSTTPPLQLGAGTVYPSSLVDTNGEELVANVVNNYAGSLVDFFYNNAFRTYRVDGKGNIYHNGVESGATGAIASAATIAPSTSYVSVSGTAVISTITLPTNFVDGCIDILATGAWSTTTGGNINTVMTAVSGNQYRACYYGSAWYIGAAASGVAYAPLASPALTGTPTAPTATLGTNTTQLATTAFVLANGGSIPGGSLGSIPYQSAPGATALLAPNLTATLLCLTQTGTGTAGAAPAWNACSGATFGGNYAGTTTGAVNVMAATLTPAPGTLAAMVGVPVSFLPNLTNTTTNPTINFNSLGAETITKCGNTSLVAGDLSTTAIADVIWNGTNAQLLNPQAAICQPSTAGQFTVNGSFISTTSVQSASGYLANSKATNLTYQAGQDVGYAGNLGSATFRGASNSSTGAAGNGSLEAGANTGGGLQGWANVQQSFTTASALAATFEAVSMTTTADQVQASPTGSVTNVGIAQTVGGTGTQLYVVSSGKTTARFDGTPAVGDLACYPLSGGTVGLLHDNGTTACTLGESAGVITGQVSGTGSGSTATIEIR